MCRTSGARICFLFSQALRPGLYRAALPALVLTARDRFNPGLKSGETWEEPKIGTIDCALKVKVAVRCSSRLDQAYVRANCIFGAKWTVKKKRPGCGQVTALRA